MAQRPVVTPNNLLDLFLKQQSELSKQESAVIKRLIDNYGTLYKRLFPYIRNIQLILQANPDITVRQLKRMQEYQLLIEQVEGEVTDFSAYTRIELGTANIAISSLVAKHMLDFFNTFGINSKPISIDAVSLLTNFLSPDGKLAGRIELWAPNTVKQVSNSIIDGVKLGRNPVKVAQDIRKAFGVGLSDAIRTTRTAQLWSYREATRLNYLNNKNIVKGWIWLASLDDKTCMSCINMHGTVHPLTESLNDHYNGRCAMIPVLDGVDYGLQNAEDWFNSLSEAQKIKQMGVGKYKAYSDGKFTFDKLSKLHNDVVYGDMLVETPLADLI